MPSGVCAGGEDVHIVCRAGGCTLIGVFDGVGGNLLTPPSYQLTPRSYLLTSPARAWQAGRMWASTPLIMPGGWVI